MRRTDPETMDSRRAGPQTKGRRAISVQLARVTNGHPGYSRFSEFPVSGITGRDLSDSQADSTNRKVMSGYCSMRRSETGL